MFINFINKKESIMKGKMMKQSGLFAKVCDGEFNKKDIGVNLFSVQLCVHE